MNIQISFLFLSPKQQNKNKIPVSGNSKKKNPKCKKSEKRELKANKRINPKIIKEPPIPSHFQAAKSPTSIVKRENDKSNSLLMLLDEFGKVSPIVSRTTTKIKSTLNKCAKKRVDEINFCAEKLKDFIVSSLIIYKENSYTSTCLSADKAGSVQVRIIEGKKKLLSRQDLIEEVFKPILIWDCLSFFNDKFGI